MLMPKNLSALMELLGQAGSDSQQGEESYSAVTWVLTPTKFDPEGIPPAPNPCSADRHRTFCTAGAKASARTQHEADELFSLRGASAEGLDLYLQDSTWSFPLGIFYRRPQRSLPTWRRIQWTLNSFSK